MRFLIFCGLTVLIGLACSCSKVNEDCNINQYNNAPQPHWFRSFGGSEEESHGHFILSCSDGGFLQVGETGFIDNKTAILVVKTGSSGELLWQKEFSKGNHNLGNSAIEVADGYLVCGSMDKNSCIIKLDKTTGNTLFQRIMNNGDSDAFEHVCPTPSGYVAVGYVNAQDDKNTFYTHGSGYITFLDGDGYKQSGNTINLSHPYRIKPLNNDYVISGLTENGDDYGLIKIGLSGNVLWSKTYGGAQSDHCFGMDISVDGSVFLTGHTLSGTENWDTYTVKLNSDGVKIWESTQGNPRGFKPKYIHDEAWGVKATSDGGCVLVAGTGDEYSSYSRVCGQDGDCSNTWHVYLIRYDHSGNVVWQKTYGGGKKVDWAGEDIDIADDGSLIVAVDNGEFGFLKLFPE